MKTWHRRCWQRKTRRAPGRLVGHYQRPVISLTLLTPGAVNSIRYRNMTGWRCRPRSDAVETPLADLDRRAVPTGPQGAVVRRCAASEIKAFCTDPGMPIRWAACGIASVLPEKVSWLAVSQQGESQRRFAAVRLSPHRLRAAAAVMTPGRCGPLSR